jgi:hypothetical protein
MVHMSAPDMHPKHLTNVLEMSGMERYEYFVRSVVESEEVWGLRGDGLWATAGDKSGRRSIPFWTDSELAELCAGAGSHWAGLTPAAMELEELLENFLPRLEADGVLVAVCPTPEGRGVVIEAGGLADALREELARQEE